MARRPIIVTQAEIERALKAARKAGARELTVEAGGVKMNFVLTGDSGEKEAAKVAKRPRTII